MNDFFTSQQMQQPLPSHVQSQNAVPQSRVEVTKRNVPQQGSIPNAGSSPVYFIPPKTEVSFKHRQSPPTNLSNPSPSAPQRQGVIHRATPNRKKIVNYY